MSATDPPDPLSAGLTAALTAARQGLAEALGLAERPLPGSLGLLRGEARGVALELRTTCFVGHGFEALFIAEIATAAGARRSATIIGLPARGALLPVLGVDLIALGGSLSLAALDLAPTDDLLWQRRAAPLLEACHARVAGHTVARRWPDFAHATFSPLALIAAARPGAEQHVFAAAAELLAGVAQLARAAALAPTDPDRADRAYQRRLAWQAAERRNRREQDALTRLFGADAAGQYLHHLFGAGALDAA
jgi:hypothetical protein